MARRIVIWALSGATVALFWFFYFTWLTWGAYHGGPAFDYSTATQLLVKITMPFALFEFHNHYAITWYVSVLLNAACYACIGLAVEGLRRAFRASSARLSH